MLFLTRSQAARAAQKVCLVEGAFWTFDVPNGSHRSWKFGTTQRNTPAVEWARNKDYVHHVETWHIDAGRQPGYRGVLVVTCFRDEIPNEDVTEALELGYSFEPITPSLWEGDHAATGERRGAARASEGGQAGRAKSDVESPVKLVWRLADEMKGSTRAEVIAACVAAGVNKATASTQFYRWQKAQNA